MYQSHTVESKIKGDEGIYAAIDAARLAQALRGATYSRLSARERLPPVAGATFQETIAGTTTSAAAAMMASGKPDFTLSGSYNKNSSRSNGGSVKGQSVFSGMGSSANGPVLGVPPRAFQTANSSEEVRARTREEALKNPSLHHEAQITVGLPDEINSAAFRALLPYMQKLRPGKTLTYDDLQRLLSVLRIAAGPGMSGDGVSTLDLTAAAVPSVVAGTADASDEAAGSEGSRSTSAATAGVEGDLQQQQQQSRISPEALESVILALREKYPLPTPKVKKSAAENGENFDEEEEEEEEDEEEAREALRHNEALRARCEQLQLPYRNYHTALQDLALYETEIFPLICAFLSKDTRIKVALLNNNGIGAESSRAEGTVDLRALRALAKMIDANEGLKVLDLSHNALGPNGIGIVSKALTKNICLQEVDLSENGLAAEPLEETEDPEYVEEDPMFGERYSGLEAVSEVLKKNKFLRILRLAGNGIHAGDDLTAPAEEDDGGIGADGDDEVEGDPLAVAVPTPEDVVAGWEEAPLWKLVSPLQYFHRLVVLDLRGNQLGVLGARMLATALSTNHSLKALDLTDNGIGYRGLQYLASLVLASPTSVLESLVLQRNDLAGKSRNPNTQKKLRLRPKKAALAAMRAFASALDGNRTVRRLVLSENHLGPVLSAAILATVHRAEVLEELDFSWNEACGDHESVLDLTAISSLATALFPQGTQYPHKPTLARLFLSGNNLCAAGLAALFPGCGLAPQFALRELDLSRNYVGDALEPLSHLLETAPVLVRLSLAYNSITTLSAMLPGLLGNDSLISLDVSHNKLGSQEEERHLPADFGGTVTYRASPSPSSSPSPDNIHNDNSSAIHRFQNSDPASTRQQCKDVGRLWHAIAAHPALQDLNLSWNDLRPAHALDFLDIFTGYNSNGENMGSVNAVVAPLAKVDFSHNAQLPISIVQRVMAALAARPGMQAVYISIPTMTSAAAALDAVVEKEEDQAAMAILQSMMAAIETSDSLLDLGCGGGLLKRSSVLADCASVEEGVEAMRRRLLLNALLTESTA